MSAYTPHPLLDNGCSLFKYRYADNGRLYALNTKSVMLMDNKDGARYSFLTLRRLSKIQITNAFKHIPNMHCNTLILPAIVDGIEDTAKPGSVDRKNSFVEFKSILIQQVSADLELLPLIE